MNRSEVFAVVGAAVADSLAVGRDEVTLESRLTTDLGADSLDFIDLVFTLEKKFGIKFRDGELEFLSKLDFSSPQVMREGFLTRETVERLADWLPALATVPDRDKVTPGALFGLITVETLCIMVERKLRAAPEGAARGT